ncbi:TldD/PmbA family protein [Patescibacteria group bacterium]|nr:TldD/PmbA family protein [Patescibacteria group bacterium]
MLNQLSDAIAKYKKRVDYLEIRAEESEDTNVQFRGKEMESVSQPFGHGGCVRALYKGGWGFVSFNDLTELSSKIEEAVSQARLVGCEKSQLARVEGVEDDVKVTFKNDPRKVALKDKVGQMQDYHRQVWEASSLVSDVSVVYSDGFSRVYFVSSQGARLVQEFSGIMTGFSVVAREKDLLQRNSATVFDQYDYSIVETLKPKINERVTMAADLLKAKSMKGGNYTVIMDPVMAGTFIHEAFGHLSEADHVYENKELCRIMKLGRRVGSASLNVVDEPTMKDGWGSYDYDDEGVKSTKTYLIKNGILSGRLHSRETAGKMGETPTGNARAAGFRSRPLVRMSNTYIEAGKASFDDMLKDIKLGVYACSFIGGYTDREMFTFTPRWAFMIRNGQLAELVRDVKLTGNVFKTLDNIEMIGNDLRLKVEPGMCGKGGQHIMVDTGAPHVRIKNITIAGQ